MLPSYANTLKDVKRKQQNLSCYEQHEFSISDPHQPGLSPKSSLYLLYTPTIFSPRATSDIQDVSDPVFVQKITEELPV